MLRAIANERWLGFCLILFLVLSYFASLHSQNQTFYFSNKILDKTWVPQQIFTPANLFLVPPHCALTFSQSCLHLNSQLSSKRPVWRGPPLFRDSSPLREVTGAVGESRVIASWCSYNPQDHARITNTLCSK